ncbi:MAG: helix-turn-helix protein [Candidatus Izimaplasma bacterium HR2]|nr:MAG: helix-turn-helix protein [Candidatus Izimaplasma bacterium HR2]
MNAENISKKLIIYRKSKSLTQVELAKEINYSDKVISKWERSESIPGIEALKILSDFYGVTVDNIISDEDIYNNELENHVLDVIEVNGPSNTLKMSILFPLGFFLFTTIQAFWDGPSILWPISIILVLIYLIIYTVLISRTSFEASYKSHKIRVANKAIGLNLYLDEKLVDSDNNLFSLGSRLSCRIGNQVIKVKVSANLFVKCQMFVE